jgi:hypothetical protein
LATLALLVAVACSASDPMGPGGGDDDDDDGVDDPSTICGDGVVDADETCDDGVNEALGGGCQPGCRASDDSDAFFARDLIEIAIEMPAADWDALRTEYKTRHSVFGTADCRTAPVLNPYTWYAATITIDGERFEDVGLRKKGHLGSQSTLKPSLKVKLDEHVADQALLGLERFALNNSKSDPSFARTCLAYRAFAAAGIPAPRCTFAHVALNGEDLGVFVAIDEVGKPMLARQLPDAEGNLYEGTASDFRPEYVGGFEQETNTTSDPARADLAALFDVIDGAADADLVAELEPLLDLEEFYAFWAVETLVWHRDGYSGNANNFYVYADPSRGGRFRFLPWGTDATFQANTRVDVPDSVQAFGVLAERLYAVPAARARYHEVLDGLLESSWDAADLVAELERIGGIVRPLLDEADRATQAATADAMATMITGRAATVRAAIAEDVDWTAGLRESPCRTPLGPISGRFSTTWNTLSTNVFTAGTASTTVALRGTPVDVTRGGSRAGFLASGAGRLQMTVDIAGNRRLSFTVGFPDERWFEPFTVVGDYPLRQPPMSMTMTEIDLSTDPDTTLGVYDVAEGTWTFEAIKTTDGAAVSGRFEGTLYGR